MKPRNLNEDSCMAGQDEDMLKFQDPRLQKIKIKMYGSNEKKYTF